MACCISFFFWIILKVIPTKRRLKNLGSVYYWEEFSWAEPVYQPFPGPPSYLP